MPTDVRPHDVPRQFIEVVRANGAEIGEGGNLLMAVLGSPEERVPITCLNGLAQKRLLSLSDVVG
jgi:hypothetical protein